MKKPATKKKKKRSSRKHSQTENRPIAAVNGEETVKKESEQSAIEAPVQKSTTTIPKKEPEKKKKEKKTGSNYFSIAVQFLREARFELKKVKWPTKKELLASTAMVIVLVLFAAGFLGLIDFGLIKFIKAVIG